MKSLLKEQNLLNETNKEEDEVALGFNQSYSGNRMTRIPSEMLNVYVCNSCEDVLVQGAPVKEVPSCTCNTPMHLTGWIEEVTHLRSDGEET